MISINLNMRCIEIDGRKGGWYVPEEINLNMRCIEIGFDW